MNNDYDELMKLPEVRITLLLRDARMILDRLEEEFEALQVGKQSAPCPVEKHGNADACPF
jgi:hypothetical protein